MQGCHRIREIREYQGNLISIRENQGKKIDFVTNQGKSGNFEILFILIFGYLNISFLCCLSLYASFFWSPVLMFKSIFKTIPQSLLASMAKNRFCVFAKSGKIREIGTKISAKISGKIREFFFLESSGNHVMSFGFPFLRCFSFTRIFFIISLFEFPKFWFSNLRFLC